MKVTTRIFDGLVCRSTLHAFLLATCCVATLASQPSRAEVVADPDRNGGFKVNGPSGRSREQVMQSFASWQTSVLQSNMASFQMTPSNSNLSLIHI